MKTILGLAVLSATVAGLYALNNATRTSDGKSVLHVAQEVPIVVERSTPSRSDIIRTVQAPGEIEAYEEVDISAEVVAKVLEMPVNEGDQVRKGDLLCRLDDADYRARLSSAEANVAKLKAIIVQAEADLEKADRDFKRQVSLSEEEATSAIELADYRTMLVRARSGLDIRRQELIESQAMLQSAKKNLEKTVITSPIDGVISQLFAEQGEVVVTGTMNNLGTRIMVISDLSKMQARCRVDEGDAPLVKDGQIARIFLQSDTRKSIPGKVLRMATKGTKPQGRDVVTFETLVLVEANDERVKPGMATNVEIEVAKSANALTIPIEAIVHKKRKDLPKEIVERLDLGSNAAEQKRRAAEYIKVVFALGDDEVAEVRLVETGINDETVVEIVSGLGDGDLVATGPYRSLDQLKQGSKTKPTDEDKSKSKDAQDKSKEVQNTDEAQASAGKSG